ncbi:hypothetical protein BSQ33_21265 [Vibrio gazogenes]|uniref:Pierisin-like domain-containing protein n=2 Tax=Vibrio gazogenes TaxID=687 RepID=A0A1Z2SLX6_VIBGA|nr:hypothetical protein BSQ33_21265 [Vibrio gazogenes]
MGKNEEAQQVGAKHVGEMLTNIALGLGGEAAATKALEAIGKVTKTVKGVLPVVDNTSLPKYTGGNGSAIVEGEFAGQSSAHGVIEKTSGDNHGSLANAGSSSSADVGSGTVLAEKNPTSSHSTDIPEYTYRGDSREPDIIFNEGFQTLGDSTDLLAHTFDNTSPPSNYISTSKSADVAADFDPDYIYVVRPIDGIDVNKTLGTDSPHPTELEIAIPNGVKPKDIRAVTLPDQQVSILNPNYE